MRTLEEERKRMNEFNMKLKELRDGKTPICPKCKSGVIRSIGNCLKTNSFHCSECDYQIIID